MTVEDGTYETGATYTTGVTYVTGLVTIIFGLGETYIDGAIYVVDILVVYVVVVCLEDEELGAEYVGARFL